MILGFLSIIRGFWVQIKYGRPEALQEGDD